MAIVNIDMDYFLNNVPYDIFGSKSRLDSNEYKTWEIKDFIFFIEEVLGLKENNKVMGKIVEHHHEVFYYWRDMIERNIINYPFKLIHIDAHADLSYCPDGSWNYINEKYLKKTYTEKIYIENLNDFGPYDKFDCGNYLLYALSCGWIKVMDYIIHPKLNELDFPPHLTKKVKDNSFVLSVGNKEDNNLATLDINILRKDQLVIDEKIDLITIAQSPQFTPKESDELMQLFDKYILTEETGRIIW